MKFYEVSREKWYECLTDIMAVYQVYAPIKKETFIDYQQLSKDNIDLITYEANTPITPLKAFYLPVKENVVNTKKPQPRVVLAVPNCDLAALDLLDNIYLNEDFLDQCYEDNRGNTIVFGKDCYQYKDTCHCTSYGIKPYPEKNCDISMSFTDDFFYFSAMGEKGMSFLEKFKIVSNTTRDTLPEIVLEKRAKTIAALQQLNQALPDDKKSRVAIEKENPDIWKKEGNDCVSCGACSFICPTCHCFLLLDKRDFEKVRNWDVCQYPGFARVAAGEDPLKKLYERFKYRYLCKYAYKPDMFKAIACTGCGRCIDTCIGKINKNEVIKTAYKGI